MMILRFEIYAISNGIDAKTMLSSSRQAGLKQPLEKHFFLAVKSLFGFPLLCHRQLKKY